MTVKDEAVRSSSALAGGSWLSLATAQDAPAPRNRFLACRQERPQHLGAGEGARHQGALALQIAAQRGGFGLAHRQLHDG
jgi:hypothetical protein